MNTVVTTDAGEKRITPSTLFAAEDVGLTYGRGSGAVVAIHGVSCAVEAEARVALVGPSGSGKSTLLHIMAGLERPTHGQVTWASFGGSPAGRPHTAGVVFQGGSLVPSLNAQRNVALPLLIAGESETSALTTAKASLDALNIGDLASKRPDELSGGQNQRVVVARVLASAPRLILADEPTGQLDHSAGMRVIDVLIQAAEQLGAALVVSTHDMNIAARFGTRWNMRDGTFEHSPDEPAPSVRRIR